MPVGYKNNLKVSDQVKKEFLLKDLELFKHSNGYHYEKIIKHLKEKQVLLSCDSYYVEPLVPIVKFYGYEAVEKALIELAKQEESSED